MGEQKMIWGRKMKMERGDGGEMEMEKGEERWRWEMEGEMEMEKGEGRWRWEMEK